MGRDSTIKFIGLDVHSKTISVAIADEGRRGEVRDIMGPLKTPRKASRRL